MKYTVMTMVHGVETWTPKSNSVTAYFAQENAKRNGVCAIAYQLASERDIELGLWNAKDINGVKWKELEYTDAIEWVADKAAEKLGANNSAKFAHDPSRWSSPVWAHLDALRSLKEFRDAIVYRYLHRLDLGYHEAEEARRYGLLPGVK